MAGRLARTARRRKGDSLQRIAGQPLTDILMAASPLALGIGLFLLVAKAIPASSAWGIIAVTIALVTLSALVGALGSIWPVVDGTVFRSLLRDTWAEEWEELVKRPSHDDKA